MKRTLLNRLFLAVPLLFAMFSTDARSTGGVALLTVTPDHIRCGTFYHGTDVNVVADVPLCDGAVLKIERDGGETVLNRKGRVGFVWLNVAKVTVAGAPVLYILASSSEVTSICSIGERERLGIGLDALRAGISFQSDAPLTGQEFREFLKLKRHAGTYNEDIPIQMEGTGEGRQRIEASIPLPSAAPSGDYNVRLYCFQDGAMIGEASAGLTIESVGFPRFEYELAHGHAATYGIMAILVAMVAGLGTGLVFSSRGERGR
jgi:uncharacterized protein (TIGR02186 family)